MGHEAADLAQRVLAVIEDDVEREIGYGFRPPFTCLAGDDISERFVRLAADHADADGIASMDLFMVPTISFRPLYRFLILQHSRRELLWLGVTAHPSAEWIARQLNEAYGWQQAPRYTIRDRDCVYGSVFLGRLRAMGIRDTPIAMAERMCGEAHRIDPAGMS